MGPDRAKNVRNILIIVGLALVVWLLPGGDKGSNTIYNLLTVILTAGLLFFAYRLYMEHRATIFGLGDRTRASSTGRSRWRRSRSWRRRGCGTRAEPARCCGSR